MGGEGGEDMVIGVVKHYGEDGERRRANGGRMYTNAGAWDARAPRAHLQGGRGNNKRSK